MSKVIIDSTSDSMALIEAALYAAGRALCAGELAEISGRPEEEARAAAESLSREYALRNGGLEIRSFEDSYVMQVRPELSSAVSRLAPREIDAPLMRTLAIIAYNQPMAQSELARIRGNKSYEHVRELARMGLISTVKKGRTRELRTSKGFAEYFGLDSDSPDFVRHVLGKKRHSIGVTPMFESLARRMGLDYVVVNPYHPGADDIARMGEIEMLIVSPGYADRIQQHYSGRIVEASSGTLSQLKEDVEKIAMLVDGHPGAEPLIAEIDGLLHRYRELAIGSSPVAPATQLVRDVAADLQIPVQDDGIPASTDNAPAEAEVNWIRIPAHQDYSMDIIERIVQRYEAMIAGARGARP